MPDVEMVINGMEKMLEESKYNDSVQYNPWADTETLEDALALLQAQEAREPHYTKLEYIVNGMPVVINHPECPRCYDNGLVLWDAEIEKGAAYCKRCGKAVKWE